MTTKIELTGKIWTGTLSNPVMSGDGQKVGFEFELLTPVQEKTPYFFSINETPKIRLHRSCGLVAALLNHVGGKVDWVEFTIDKMPEVVKAIADTREAYLAEQAAVTITSWQWALGGDTHQTHIYPEPSADTPAVSEMQEFVRKNAGRLALEKHSHKIEDIKSGLYTPFGWNEISDADLQLLVAAVREEIAAKKKIADDAKQAKFDAALVQAKETGKPAILNSWMDECNDRREECDMDEVIEYVFPDGHRETKRFHTW